MRPDHPYPLATGADMLRFLALFAAALIFIGVSGGLVRAQQPQLHFTPFPLTLERANALADLPLTLAQRAQLLGLLQQWSSEQDAAQQAAELAKQNAALKAQVEDLQKLKEDKKPEPSK
jgi:hypothetical protein